MRHRTTFIHSSSGNNLGEFNYNEKGYYWKLPNGLIFQWGYIKAEHGAGHGTDYVEFPISFTNKAIMGTGNVSNSTTGLDYNSGGVDNLTTKGMKISCDNPGAYWLAIGNLFLQEVIHLKSV